jgi:DNA-binding transcriptional MerR regulator
MIFLLFLLQDLDKSLAAQKALLQQQQELEAESAEMQDFLQEEKATLADALKDSESEVDISFLIYFTLYIIYSNLSVFSL